MECIRGSGVLRFIRFQLSFLIILFVGLSSAGNADNHTTTSSLSGLYWNGLSVHTSDGICIVHNFDGFIANGHVCGILGPSGAGKSTTLSALGGTISPNSGLLVNGETAHYDSNKNTKEILQVQGGQVAWLQQKDAFFSMLTVQETLELAAFLELPKFSKQQREWRVQSTMDSLGLTKLRNRRIGDSAMHKGLSGGEQRRLSLALELLASPKLFIGDEPTSGLDSTLSEKVVRLIRKSVKQRDIPCILSLHQPSSSIWRMLDSVILMAPGGRVCYFGDSREAVNYFSNLGYNCPNETNPAEFLLDLVSIDSEDPKAAGEDEARILRLAVAFVDHQKEKMSSASFKFSEAPVEIKMKAESRSFASQLSSKFRLIKRFGWLLMRSWKQNIRNHRVNLLRLVGSVGNAALFTHIFKSIKKGVFSAKSVADRTAMLTFGIINMSMMALMKTIDLFAKEKPVVQREQQRQQYSSLEYLVSKAIAEIPLDAGFAAVFTTVLKSMSGIRIGWKALTATFALMTVSGASLGFAIGALSPTAEVAMSAGVPIMVILMTVGVINPSGVDSSEPQPMIVEALKQLSPVAYAVKAVCLAEYRGMEFQKPGGDNGNFFQRGASVLRDLPKMGALALVKNGDQVLEELGLANETYSGAMKHLAILSVANLLLSLLGLQLQNNSSGRR